MSITFVIMIFITIMFLALLLTIFLMSNPKIIDSISRYIDAKSYAKICGVLVNIGYVEMYNEFENFSLKIIYRLIFERLLKSKKNANGIPIALIEISDMSNPFFQGIVAQVLASIGPELSKRFYLFHSRSSDNEQLISAISAILDSYVITLHSRMAIYQNENIKRNRESIDKGLDPNFQVDEAIYSNLTLSISNDITRLNNPVNK